MIYIKWLFLLIFNLFMVFIVNWPLAPIIVLFAKDNGWLPNWLWWFQTDDNSLDGDDGWKNGTRPIKNETNKFYRWINRFSWIRRNSCYGFSKEILGVKVKRSDRYYSVGNEHVGNGPLGKSGLIKRYVIRDGKPIAFQIYYVRQYKRWPNKCFRLNLGWKIWSPDLIVDNNRLHFTFNFSPFMHFIL